MYFLFALLSSIKMGEGAKRHLETMYHRNEAVTLEEKIRS